MTNIRKFGFFFLLGIVSSLYAKNLWPIILTIRNWELRALKI